MIELMAPRTFINGSMMWSETQNRTTSLLMSPEGYVGAAVVLFFIGFFGFFLNIIVILLMIKDKELRTPMNMILFNLACSDFSVSVLGNPWTLTSAIFQHWIFGRTMCVIYGFFMSLLGISSITTLTVLSFERYVMISRPFNRHHLTNQTAGWAVVFIWLYAFCLTGPPLFGWGSYVNEAANISTTISGVPLLGSAAYSNFLVVDYAGVIPQTEGHRGDPEDDGVNLLYLINFQNISIFADIDVSIDSLGKQKGTAELLFSNTVIRFQLQKNYTLGTTNVTSAPHSTVGPATNFKPVSDVMDAAGRVARLELGYSLLWDQVALWCDSIFTPYLRDIVNETEFPMFPPTSS